MREARLGEFLTLSLDPVSIQPAAQYATAGILSYGKGLFHRPVVMGKDVSYSRYFRLRRDQFVYSRLFGWEGALAVVSSDFDGVFVSQEFPSFDIDRAQAHPEFVALLCRWPDLIERLRGTETGMGGRRKRIHPAAMLNVSVPLPPLAEQRRIVDLVTAIDEAFEAANGESVAAWRAQSAFLESRIPPPGSAGSSIDSILSLDIGGVWGSEPGVDECDVAVYRSTEFGSDGWADPRTAALRSVSLSQMKSRALRGGDILLEKSGGTPTRPVGRVVRCREPFAPTVISNFVQLLRPVPATAEPSFLFWVLWSWHRRGIPAEYQTATTNIRNLRTREYLGLRVELPEREEQRAISAAADALQELAMSAAASRNAIEQLRSSVLTDLLTGARSVPVSYDRFLDGAA